MAKILVVEDSPEVAALMSLTLSLEGYEVLSAFTGISAMQIAIDHTPSLILMDIMMPGLTGFQVAERLKADEKTRDTPIIFVTARHEVDDRVQGLELAVDYIAKPFAVPELLARVRSALRMAALLENNKIASSKATKMKPQKSTVFLCHASEDKESVRKLDKDLTAAGVTTWLDEKDLLPGQDWDLEIRKALKSSTIVLVCLSTNAINKRGYVQKEIVMALDVLDQIPEGQIFLVPVMLEECDLPDRLSSRHAVKIYEPSGIERLIKAIKYQIPM